MRIHHNFLARHNPLPSNPLTPAKLAYIIMADHSLERKRDWDTSVSCPFVQGLMWVWQSASTTPVKTNGELGSLWACRMANWNFRKDASNLWQRIWAHSLPPENKWRCMQDAMQIFWDPLDDATQAFKNVWHPSVLSFLPPALSLSFSLSLSLPLFLALSLSI